MTNRPSVITFDCYGTLVDWEGGIFAAFEALAEGAGKAVERETLLAAYAEIEPAVQAAAFRPYRDVLRETAAKVAERFGLKVPHADRDFLARSLPGWPPFADTTVSLRAIQAMGIAVGILSNIDRDLLDGTLRHLAIEPEIVITAEEVRSYKPAHAHFLTARQRIGGRTWLHAAQSVFHDVVPARELEIPVAWINRGGDPLPHDGPVPDERFADLSGLVAWLGR